MKTLAAIVLLVSSFPALALCPPRTMSDPAQVRFNSDSLMIVTHASSNDDGRLSSKFGVDAAVRHARLNRVPVVYLQDDRPAQNYFMEDCKPDHWVFSMDGEVKFDVSASHLYVAGGHLEECLSRTLHDVLEIWSKKPRRDLTVTYFMDGIFSNGKRIEPEDPYHKSFVRFMGVVNYARPAGETFPKLNLLETMGLIINEQRQFDYLTRVLPHFARTLPDYRVELAMSDTNRTRVLQPGKGRLPPVLRFEFIDSADNRNYIKLSG